MTDFPRPRAPPTLHPASLSPPLNFGPGQGSMPGPYLGPSSRALADPYATTYNMNNRPPLSHGSAHFNNDLDRYVMTSQRTLSGDSYGQSFAQHGNGYHQQPTSQEISFRSSQGRSDSGGPPFEETKVIYPILTGRSQQLVPEITAGIQKGFFKVEQKWTCYRRNYFTVTCSFNLRNQPVDGPLYINRLGWAEPVIKFAVSISAKTAAVNNQESEPRSLVQHTPKRDKLSETNPKPQVIQPTPPTPGGNLAVNGHTDEASQHVSSGAMSSFEPFGPTQHQQPPASHTFERIQFQKATANNGKRRAQQQYFHVVVELLGDIGRSGGQEEWVTIATKQSHPMVVRGRSPGHYKDNARRDSTTSMDPDRGTGPGGDGTNGQHNMSSLLGNQSHLSSMDWTSTHRHGGQYGGSAYQYTLGFGYSPKSGSSSAFTSSPTEMDSEIPDTSHVSPSSVLSIHDSSQQLMFEQDRPIVDESPRYSSSPRKRPFEEDFVNVENPYHPHQAVAEGLHGSMFDYSATPQPKAVCASS